MNEFTKELVPGLFHHTCGRCKKYWTSKNKSPATCAKCRSPYWNKARVMKTSTK